MNLLPCASCGPSMRSRSISAVVTLIFVAFLSACGDVGRPAADATNLAPQSFTASRQVLSGSSQDFSGGGTSDILWRNDNGQVAIWLMNGMAQSSSAVIATVGNEWKIAASGDFDGDGKSDIVWRNSNGQVAIWLMNGMAQKSSAIIATVSTDWTIAGTGDFNGDGKSDILWRNTNGQVAIWLMNGMAQSSSAVIATVGNEWKIAASGDFDGDGKSDILWRNTNGQVAIWLMNGMAQKSGGIIATVTTNWTIVGAGDFDGDGKSDILWRNTNGQVAIWLMNGLAQKSSAIIATESTGWTIAGTGDFNGDGKSDILWRNTNGQVAIWLMNGMARSSGAVIATVTTDWTISNGTIASGSGLGSATNFTASAMAGELLIYTLDTSALTFSYTISESQYGLKGHTGSGGLTKNSDGSYTPSGMGNAIVTTLPNGLLLGAIRETVNGTLKTIPVMGISNPVTTLSNSTFNYIQRVCYWNGWCESGYGTFQLTTAGTWASCPSGNVTTGCPGGSYSGTVKSLGGGLWQVSDVTGFNIGTAIVLSSGGQQVVFLDLKDARVSDYASGVGLLVGSTQQAPTTAQTDGTWVVAGSNGDNVRYLVSGTKATCQIRNGAACSDTTTLRFNLPWTGLATTSSGGYALLAGTGVYALQVPDDYIEIGIKLK